MKTIIKKNNQQDLGIDTSKVSMIKSKPKKKCMEATEVK